MPNVVGERYQITIEKKLRERLGIKPGDQAFEYVEDGLLKVEFLPKPHDRSLRGILKRPEVSAGSTDSGAEKESAWKARSEEVEKAMEKDSKRHRAPSRRRAS